MATGKDSDQESVTASERPGRIYKRCSHDTDKCARTRDEPSEQKEG